ncbi:MAG: phage portal protein [Tissierellia bacterium]|nr:phage portal protein [Tissierellia bacterium]
MNYKELSESALIEYIKSNMTAREIAWASMQESKDYYNYAQAIDQKERLGISRNGRPVPIANLPNNKLIDNQYALLVDKKVNYLFSKPPIVKCKEDEAYQKEVQDLYSMSFVRTLNKIALDSYLCGINWMHVFPSEDGQELHYKKIDPMDVCPIWGDKDHESLDALIHKYTVNVIEGDKVVTKQRMGFYTRESVSIFEYEEYGDLKKIEERPHIIKGNKGYNFKRIPFIYFKSNSLEIPLLKRVKSLQDAINTILSNFVDNVLEDPRNTILVLKNYDGEDLGGFREKLAQYGAIKVRSEDGSQGGVDTLEINVDHENYKTILQLLKEALIENGRGLDAKNDKTSTQPNELNIKSMYADIELDANATELEFQASLEYFEYFYRTIKGMDPDGPYSKVEFRRNIMVNDQSQVEMIKSSMGIISRETLIANHPMVDDTEEELKQLDKEKKEMMDDMYNPFLGGDGDELLGAKGNRENKEPAH